jgi:hypothetical protein
MAKLTPDQQNSVTQWAAEGATLNDIQDRLKRECGVTLTYMDTRLLIMELGLKLQDKPREKMPEETPQPAPADALPPDDDRVAGEDVFPEEAPAAGTGNVTLSIDQIAIPGTMVSGKVTFSDGKSAGWYLDQYGRLGLRGAEPGYQPPPADIPTFQRELQRLLQGQGY